jgi:outer membrane lipoprotein-sorting protein
MSTAERIEKLVKEFLKAKNSYVATSPQIDEKVLGDALTAFEKSKTEQSAELRPSVWRIVMKSKITKFAAAAIIIVAAVLSINIFDKSLPTASATQVLQDAIKAVSDVWSVHMKARMRTLPDDNFSLIGLELDFVPIEMWKRTSKEGLVQWRVEKPGRVLLMDGKSTLMLIRPNHGVIKKRPLPQGCFDSWQGLLLNVQDLLDDELQVAKNDARRQVIRQKIEGRDKLILKVEVKTNVAKDDYLRNIFISESDHLKVYQFDAQTKLLESFQVYVHSEEEDVLIFEVTDIEYNKEIDDSIFKLDLPEDMIWYGEPQALSDNEKYRQMGPKEMATVFFEACSREDWGEALKFLSTSVVGERKKKYYGGLEIISIGEPFRSGNYAGWIVPYKVKLQPAEAKVRLSNSNPAKRFVITGIYDSKMQFLSDKEEMQWSSPPEMLADNDTYAKMTPSEVVKAFYEAFSRLDWNEMRKFAPDSYIGPIKGNVKIMANFDIDIQGQFPTVEIGEVFWSAEQSAYFVTCYESSRVQQCILSVRNDNAARRYVVDGGF